MEEARAYYQDSDVAHDFDHVLRVLALAEGIGRAEGADMEVLRVAALLHDVARAQELETGICHARAGAKRAREILAAWPCERVEAVAHAIETHRFRGSVSPQTLEAKVLYDADKLDCIGAVGVARAYLLAGRLGQRLWTEVPSDASQDRNSLTAAHSASIEYEVKLKKVKDGLFTRTAKALAEERDRFMGDFFIRLKEEIEGRR